MLKFTTCPKCKAEIEDVPGVPCWNCGFVAGGSKRPAEKNAVNVLGEEYNHDAMAGQHLAFKTCSKCGSQCENFATRCWQCGSVFQNVSAGVIATGSEGSAIAEKKKVPFSENISTPPDLKKKPNILESVAKIFKPAEYLPDEEMNDSVRNEEHDLKKERKLILFHCPKCKGYFKVIFRRVHAGVKCPECKDTRMKIPFYCTRCKHTEDFDTLDPHVCKTCNINMILDPNYE